jgi:hypothetical protein
LSLNQQLKLWCFSLDCHRKIYTHIQPHNTSHWSLLLFSSQNPHEPCEKKTTGACWTLDASSWQCQTTCCKQSFNFWHVKTLSIPPPTLQPRSSALWLLFVPYSKKGSFQGEHFQTTHVVANLWRQFKCDVQNWLQSCLWWVARMFG